MSIDLQKFNSTISAQHTISLNYEFLHSSLIKVNIIHHHLILKSAFLSVFLEECIFVVYVQASVERCALCCSYFFSSQYGSDIQKN